MLTRVSSSVGSTVTAMVCTVVESHSDAVVVATVFSTLVVVVDGDVVVAVVHPASVAAMSPRPARDAMARAAGRVGFVITPDHQRGLGRRCESPMGQL